MLTNDAPKYSFEYKGFLSLLKEKGVSEENVIEASLPKEDQLQFDVPRRLRELDREKQKTGILSLSETYKSLLMWPYYADDHYGYCLEFSSKEQHGRYHNGLSHNKFIGKVV